MDWIGITCWAVLGLAAALMLWALLWDRARGRLRCRRCAYDMSGGGLLCPECGRDHKNERVLRRTRRKWKTACIGVVLLSVTMLVRVQRFSIYSDGISGVVPTLLLAVFADPHQVMSKYEGELDWDELSWLDDWFIHRLGRYNAGHITLRFWAKRIARACADDPEAGTIRVYDLSPMAMYSRSRGLDEFDDFSWRKSFEAEGVAELYSRYLLEIVLWHVDPKAEPYTFLAGDQLVVQAPVLVQERLAATLVEVEQRFWSSKNVDIIYFDNEDSFVRYDVAWLMTGKYVETGLLFYQVQSHIRGVLKVASNDRGAGVAYAYLGGDIVVWGSPDHHREIMEYLNSVELEAQAGN